MPKPGDPREMADRTLNSYESAMAGSVRVHVLVLQDCTPIVSVGVADLLRKARDLSRAFPGKQREIEVRLVSFEQKRVRAAGGIELVTDVLARHAPPADLVLVPALDPDVLERLERNRVVVPYLQKAFQRGADVASACTGAFLLAEAGLLDGRSATTHWAFQDLFRARYPQVRLLPQAVLVDGGRVTTAGGATSFLSLTLLLVERFFGQEVARAAAKMFLVDTNKSPQGAYAIFTTQKQHEDDAIRSVQDLIEVDPAADLGTESLAKIAKMSTRTFARRFRAATGNTPLEYVQRARVEAAKRALEHASTSVQEVAARVGYGDPVAFRKLFVRTTGLTPSEYRLRYGPRVAPGWVLSQGKSGRSKRARV